MFIRFSTVAGELGSADTVRDMPLEDANTYRFDPFDVTKVWSQKDYPLIEVGRMVLDRLK